LEILGEEFLCEIEDIDCLAEKSKSLLKDYELRENFVNENLEQVKKFDWQNIAEKYYQKMYRRYED